MSRITAFLLLALLAPPLACAVPAYETVKHEYISTEGVLLDRNAEPIHELRVDLHGRRLSWVQLTEVSPALLEAVIRAEDKRFFHHGGVDWLALSDAALGSLFSSKPRGASTLSMQAAAMLEGKLKRGKEHRTLSQKWDQIKAARTLEKAWTKRQILEAYLNLSTFRGELQGVGAASRALFGKQPSGLNEREALLLAALLRGPNATAEAVAKRACALGRSMQPPQLCDGLDTLAHEALAGVPNLRPSVALAPHVARMLVTPEQRRVQSTLDGALQAFVLDAVNRQLVALDQHHVGDAAVLVVDNATGEVLAYLGNSGESSSARYVDGVKAARQAGSALKPFLYELALEQRLLTAASLLDDAPINIVTPGGLYVPQDYDREFKGLVSLRTALSGSLNVPAVRTLTLVGPEAFVDRLRALGFEHIDRDGDYYGYSLALGSAEVSLWELTNAYRALTGGGVLAPLTLTPGTKVSGQSVMDRAASYIVADILSDRAARSITFGLASPLAARFWAAVKTGTSKGMRDNWCVGSSLRYTVGVWVGNFDGSPMWDVSGVTGAAPLWLEIMNELHRTGAGAPAPPPGVETAQVSFVPPVEAPRQELFVAGTAVERVAAKDPEQSHPSIVYPEEGQIFAVDPDIPSDRQRVLFEALGAGPGARWRLNGEALDGAAVLWRPQPGKWLLTLHDADGTQLDAVRFEVRGSVQ
ncbi:MAG TPA: penicillin-binding protein 1C [Burkholderiales bacterium]|nr:penicillin-binding protein 1C [Burkholderiales bacterium]